MTDQPAVPAGIVLEENPEYLVIARPRFDPISKGFFTVFIPLLGAIAGEKAIDLWQFIDASLGRLLLGVVFGLTALLLGYMLVGVWRNRVSIYASQSALEIRHRPLPLRRDRRLARSEILDITVYHMPRSHYGGAPSSGVQIYLAGGKHQTVLSMIYPHSHATFIADRLRAYWGMSAARNR